MKKLLTFILILCAVTGSAQMRGGALYDPGAARSNLANITSGSALGVANGGTGKTTAAEALAALGGASLNGSSTVAFNCSSIDSIGNFSNWPGISSAFKSREVTLSDDASVDLETLLHLAGDCMGTVEIVATSGGLGIGSFILVGAADVSMLGDNYNCAATDEDGKLCVFPSGSGNYTLKNRLGVSAAFLVIYKGRR